MQEGRMIKDALDQEIETKRREVEEARARLGGLELELHTLERAAQLRPGGGGVNQRSTPTSETFARKSQRGGRQPGAISNEWREILGRVAAVYPEGATAEDIASFGPAIGLANLRPRDARQQAEKYIGLGYFERIGERYKVTPAAWKRFEFSGDPVPKLIPPGSEGGAYDEVA
jgi:hypothetical protein